MSKMFVNQILQILLHPIPNIILIIFFEEENPNLNGSITPQNYIIVNYRLKMSKMCKLQGINS